MKNFIKILAFIAMPLVCFGQRIISTPFFKCRVFAAAASPNSVITATTGDFCLSNDGTAWMKTSGSNTNTGWVQVNVGLAMAAFGSTANANGATISSNTLTLQPASATLPGGVTAGTQNLGGQKTLILNNAGISQQLILDNQQATPAIGYGSSLALAVNNVQKADLRVQIDSLGTTGADYAKVRLNAQNGGAMKIVYDAKMKNVGVDEISFFPEDDGVMKMSRRIVTPYTNVALTGDATLTAGYSTYVLTGTQILTDVWTVTLPTSASMLDGEVITISNSIAGVSGATLQLTANSGQTLLGFTGNVGFGNTVGFADRRAIQLMFKTGGTWITLAEY